MSVATNIENTAPAWNAYTVATFNGAFDTRIKTGEDYPVLTLADIFTMQPADRPKGSGAAFIPSSYADYDAREHAVQRSRGEFVALTGDVDSGNHSGGKILKAVKAFAGPAAYLIYSSAHARPGDMRWRIVLPLSEPCDFGTWFDAQSAFFAFMEAQGIDMDHALARAAQPVYLPNVPPIHSKTETPLRGEDGVALFYKTKATPLDTPGLDLAAPPVSEGMAALRRARVEDQAKREQMRREAEQRRANQPRGDGASIIDDFNASNSVATMLEMCGYEQSPRSAEDWRSPHQTGETYATQVIGSKWYSLSQSDVAAGVGSLAKAGGCFGDAYDLYAHYKHGGDHKAAYRSLAAEARADNVIYPAQFEASPPEWMSEIPDYDEAPDYGDAAYDVDLAQTEGQQPEQVVEGLDLFDPAEWTGQQPPERQWRWDSFIPDFQATLLTGAGAAGKSLATQQMCTCIALGLPFLGIPTKQARALYITCEDDMQELHRRQESICVALGVKMADLSGKLWLLSLQGQIGNELATFDNEGSMKVAPRYTQIEQACLSNGIGHVTLDNTAHTFAGNENDRHEVAAFVNLNNRLAQTIGGSVVMVGHPNKAGDSYSGSTAWENQVRSRLYLEVPRSEEGAPVDPDMRVLRNEKANYSQRGAEVTFYWLKGAFVTEDEMPKGNERELRESAHAAYENGVFLTLLDMLTKQRRQVSHAPNVGTYAPKVMAGMPEAKGLNKGQLARAMERLFHLGEIEASVPLWPGKDRHPVLGLARAGGVK